MLQKQSCRCQLWMGRTSTRWAYLLWHHLYPQHWTGSTSACLSVPTSGSRCASEGTTALCSPPLSPLLQADFLQLGGMLPAAQSNTIAAEALGIASCFIKKIFVVALAILLSWRCLAERCLRIASDMQVLVTGSLYLVGDVLKHLKKFI